MAVKRGEPGAALPAAAGAPGRAPAAAAAGRPSPPTMPARSDVATDNAGARAAVLGDRVVKGIPLADYAAFLDERATFLGQWGLKPARGSAGALATRSWSRPRAGRGCGCGWSGSQTEGLLEAGVVYGYFPAVSEGNDLVVLDEDGSGAGAVHLPAAAARPAPVPGRLLPAPRVRRDRRGRPSSWSRWASGSARRPPSCSPRTPTATTWSCTGCPCSSTEALAEYWHARVRAELGLGGVDPRRPGRHPQGGLPRLPVLVRLPGLPRPGGPGEGGPAARARSGSA